MSKDKFDKFALLCSERDAFEYGYSCFSLEDQTVLGVHTNNEKQLKQFQNICWLDEKVTYLSHAYTALDSLALLMFKISDIDIIDKGIDNRAKALHDKIQCFRDDFLNGYLNLFSDHVFAHQLISSRFARLPPQYCTNKNGVE